MMMLGSRCGAWEKADDGGKIKTFEEFYDAIVNHPTEEYILGADITLTEWVPCSFSGILHGNGHKLLGLTDSLFSSLDGSVDGLTLRGNDTTIYVIPDADFGVLATTATGASIRNCSISGFRLVSQQVTTTTRPGLGFFVGRAYDGCSFSECSTDTSCSVDVGVNVYCGGIAGRVDRSESFSLAGLATFKHCVNYANCSSSVKNTTPGSGAFGGILGISAKPGTITSSITFFRCKNFGSLSLSADDNSIGHTFGGIVGKYEGQSSVYDENLLEIVACENDGGYRKPSGSSKNATAGGIIGYCGTYCALLQIERCVNSGDFIATGSEETTAFYFGGFVGYMGTPSRHSVSHIINSVQRGNISVTGGTTTSGASGAFGYIRSVSTASGLGVEYHIENCSFEGVITANAGVRAMIAVAGTKARAGTVFNVRNCWVSEDAPRLLNYETNVPDYSESDLQIHADGGDAAECAALDAVAATVEEYLSWKINTTTTHPEPIIP